MNKSKQSMTRTRADSIGNESVIIDDDNDSTVADNNERTIIRSKNKVLVPINNNAPVLVGNILQKLKKLK
ncbi:hypothetical protein I4U23_031536 [Adineta vaga]|nr:hypothetical protein I4U23_031536 [Adineta vaga]